LAGGAGNIAIGLGSIFAAAWLAWPHSPGRCSLGKRFAALSPFLLGIGLTLIPCAPLATLLAACAAAGDAANGARFGFLFGLGTLLTPMVVLIPSAASLGRALRSGRAWLTVWLRGGAAVVLAVLGYRRIEQSSHELPVLALTLMILCVVWAHYRRKQIAGRNQALIRMPIKTVTGAG
jgi:thiol:disulfide interchange protein DsbD